MFRKVFYLFCFPSKVRFMLNALIWWGNELLFSRIFLEVSWLYINFLNFLFMIVLNFIFIENNLVYAIQICEESVLTSMRVNSSLVILPTNSFLARINSEMTAKKILVATSIKVGNSSMSWLFNASYVALHFSTSSWNCKGQRNVRYISKFI